MIAAGSMLAGLAEAGVLALVAYIATAMSTEAPSPELILGPLAIDGRTSFLLAAALVLAVTRFLLQIVVVRLPARLSGHVQTQLRKRLFSVFLSTSWLEKTKEKSGYLQELMGGHALQAGLAVIQLAYGLTAALMFLVLAASAFALSAVVAGSVLLSAVLLFASLRPLSSRVRLNSAATSAAFVSQATGVAESVRMAEEIHTFGTAEAERSRIDSMVESLEQNFVRTRALSASVPVLYQNAVILLVLVGLAILYVIGTTHVAALGAAVLLLIRASSYGQQLQYAYQCLGESLPYLDRIASADERYRAGTPKVGHGSIDEIRTLDFERVCFEFKPGVPVLSDITFSINAGEAIGVVGPSAAGKSTILQLLLRLREPSTGQYLVNGMPAEEIDDVAWHRIVAYLPQEPHVLDGTVAENVRFYRDYVGDAAIEHACRLARIDEDIMSWTDGYDTHIGHLAEGVWGGDANACASHAPWPAGPNCSSSMSRRAHWIFAPSD